MPDKPSVLFVCVHNAGRSQMAAAWLARLAVGRVEVRSAGSFPAGQGIEAVHPVRDEIRELVEGLLAEILPPAGQSAAGG